MEAQLYLCLCPSCVVVCVSVRCPPWMQKRHPLLLTGYNWRAAALQHAVGVFARSYRGRGQEHGCGPLGVLDATWRCPGSVLNAWMCLFVLRSLNVIVEGYWARSRPSTALQTRLHSCARSVDCHRTVPPTLHDRDAQDWRPVRWRRMRPRLPQPTRTRRGVTELAVRLARQSQFQPHRRSEWPY